MKVNNEAEEKLNEMSWEFAYVYNTQNQFLNDYIAPKWIFLTTLTNHVTSGIQLVEVKKTTVLQHLIRNMSINFTYQTVTVPVLFLQLLFCCLQIRRGTLHKFTPVC